MSSKSAIALICFFASGAAGLVYQICWIRRATQLFGSTTHAVSIVVALFFLGLAVGSFVFGRVAMRSQRPLRSYGWIEVAVGLLALGSLPLFDFMGHTFTPVYRALSGNPLLVLPAQAALVAVIILPPAIGMGGTLPLLCRHFVAARGEIVWKVGSLYSLNTLGAAAGTFATGFLLLPLAGLQSSVIIGAGLSLAAGIGVLLMPVSRVGLEDARNSVSPHSSGKKWMPVASLFFITGFVGIALEVIWVRFLALLVRNTVHTYTIALGAVLVGILLGSLMSALLLKHRGSRALWFGALQIMTGLSVMFLISLPPAFWGRLGSESWICLVALLPPSLLSGASFPLAVRMVSDVPALTGLNVGRLGATNILGGILGSLLAGWLGLPHFGIAVCFAVVTGLSLLAGFLAWFYLEQGVRNRVLLPFAVIAVALWGWSAVASKDRLPGEFLGSNVIAYNEGLISNLAVLKRDGELHLEIDRWWQGSNQKNHQIMSAHLPSLLHGSAESVLVIGAGTGQTASRFLMHNIQRLDCVDIEPAVFDFIGGYFASEWMSDPRTSLIHEDGRNYLRHTEASYDIISLEVGQIFRPGVAYFYTRDFYELAFARLDTNGLIVQFVPLPFFSLDQFRSTIRTFTEVFPHATLWYNTSELLLIGAKSAPVIISAAKLQSGISNSNIVDDLQFAYWGGSRHELNLPDNLLASFLIGPPQISAICEGGVIYTDDRPRLDYETRYADALDSDETPLIDEIERNLSPISDIAAVDPERSWQVRELNLADMRAQIRLRRVESLRESADYSQIISLLTSALELNPQNVTANRFIGDALLHQGQAADALNYFDAALELRPNDARARYGRAVSFHKLGRLDEAIADYRAAIEFRAQDPEYHSNLGAALGQSGRFDEAIRAFETALELDPDFDSARNNLLKTREALQRQR